MSKTNASDDFSDFEQIDGLSDCGSTSEGVEVVNEAISFDLPAVLRSEVGKNGSSVPSGDNKDNKNAEVGSVESASFVKNIGNLKIGARKKNLDDSEDEDEVSSFASSWSHVGGGSVAASSTISGFDILSLSGGESKRSCHQCTFLNNDKDGICGGCGVALIANPCLDADEQVARKLQENEEALALKELQSEENKRKAMSEETVLVRSQILVNDIVSFVQNCQKTEKGAEIDTIQKESLVILASRFIESMDRANMEGGVLRMVYYFSTSSQSRMRQIRQDGLGPYASVSTNIEAAYDEQAKCSAQKRNLFSIPEEDDGKPSCLGWIVATIDHPGSFSKTTVKVSSGSAEVRRIIKSDDTLPLVCFDSSLRKKDIIRRLLNGLFRVCNDFFQDSWSFRQQREIEETIHEVVAAPPSKKPRASVEGQQKHEPNIESMIGESFSSAKHSDIDWSSCRDASTRNRAMTTGSIQHAKDMLWLPQHHPVADDCTTAACVQKQEELLKQKEETDGQRLQPGEPNLQGLWFDIGDANARDKVGHSLRDQVTAINRGQAQLVPSQPAVPQAQAAAVSFQQQHQSGGQPTTTTTMEQMQQLYEQERSHEGMEGVTATELERRRSSWGILMEGDVLQDLMDMDVHEDDHPAAGHPNTATISHQATGATDTASNSPSGGGYGYHQHAGAATASQQQPGNSTKWPPPQTPPRAELVSTDSQIALLMEAGDEFEADAEPATSPPQRLPNRRAAAGGDVADSAGLMRDSMKSWDPRTSAGAASIIVGEARMSDVFRSSSGSGEGSGGNGRGRRPTMRFSGATLRRATNNFCLSELSMASDLFDGLADWSSQPAGDDSLARASVEGQQTHEPNIESMIGESFSSAKHSDIDWSSCRDASTRNPAMTTGSIQHAKDMLWLPQHHPVAGDCTTAACVQKQEELLKQKEETDGQRLQPGEPWAPPAAAQPSNPALPGATSYSSGVTNTAPSNAFGSSSMSENTFFQRNEALRSQSPSSTGNAAAGTGLSAGADMVKDEFLSKKLR